MLTPESELLPMPFPHSFGPSDHLIQMQIKVGRHQLTGARKITTRRQTPLGTLQSGLCTE